MREEAKAKAVEFITFLITKYKSKELASMLKVPENLVIPGYLRLERFGQFREIDAPFWLIVFKNVSEKMTPESLSIFPITEEEIKDIIFIKNYLFGDRKGKKCPHCGGRL